MHAVHSMLQRLLPSFWMHSAKLNAPRSQKKFHCETSNFTMIATNKPLLKRRLDTLIGDPQEVYLIVAYDIDLVFRVAIAKQTRLSLTVDPKKMSFAFSSRLSTFRSPYMSCLAIVNLSDEWYIAESILYPRIIIERISHAKESAI